MRLILGVIASLGAAAGVAAQQSPPIQALVFDEVTVVDVESGKLVPGQRVVVNGPRIQSVGAASTVAIPAKAQVVDARGKYLIPGLWDMHVHTSLIPETRHNQSDLLYPLLVANGITGMRDAHSPVSLDTMVRWRKEILAGTRIGPPRQLLTGSSDEIHVSATEKLTEAEIRQLQKRGANFLKLYPFSPPAAGAANRVGIPYGGHLNYIDFMALLEGRKGIQSWSLFEAVDSGIRIIDHPNSSGELAEYCLGNKASVEQCQQIQRQFVKHGTWWVPTLIAFAKPKPLPLTMGPVTMPVLSRFQERIQEFWKGSLLAGNWLRDSSRAEGQNSAGDSATTEPGFLRIIEQIGLPILAGSDAPSSWGGLIGGFSLHAELAILVAEGLSPLNALRAATLYPARLIDGTDSLGTVTPGKLADLVLLDADPLSDITNTTAIRAVVANGRYFDRQTLDRWLVEVQTHGNPKPKQPTKTP